jgi:LacI family transcriptional regulator
MCNKRVYHVALDSYALGSMSNEFCIGVLNFAGEIGNWRIHSDLFGVGRALQSKRVRLDGRLCMESLPRAARFQQKQGIPVVTFHSCEQWNGQTCIYSEHEEVVDLAVQHFKEVGLTEMAFCGATNKTSSAIRERHWKARMTQMGRPCHLYSETPLNLKQEGKWIESQEKLKAWLISLPRPCGILACEDGRAAELLLAAEQIEARIPEDFALLGVNDDSLICQGNHPTLSSININAMEIGYEAAKLLHDYMTGHRRNPVELTVAPKGITRRDSTSILYLQDACIEAVVKKIRTEGKSKRLTVSELHAGLPMSLRSFHYRFKQATGCSPKQEIDRVTLAMARTLLENHTHTMKEISFMLGFESPNLFSRFIRKHLKLSPTAYRKTLDRGQSPRPSVPE